MKSIMLILFSSIIIQLSYSQDTLVNMDGTYTIMPDFLESLKHRIIKRTINLEFTDAENNIIKIDTNNICGVVINSWGTWCHPCVAEIPTLNVIREKYKQSPIIFYALSFIEDSSATNIFLKKHNFLFTQIYASRSYIEDNRLVSGYPTTLFIDKKGNILKIILEGSDDPNQQESTYSEFIEGIELLLNLN